MKRKTQAVVIFLFMLGMLFLALPAAYAQGGVTTSTGGPTLTPTNLTKNACFECHIKLSDERLRKPAELWLQGEHYKNKITCERCHSWIVPSGRLARFGDDFWGGYKKEHINFKLDTELPSAIDVGQEKKIIEASEALQKQYALKAPWLGPVEGATGEFSLVVEKGLSKKQIIAICARCHGLSPVDPSNENLIDLFPNYKESVHGQSVMVSGGGAKQREGKAEVQFTATGLTEAAVCTDCHEAHDNRKASDPKSKVYKDNLIKTCAECHGGNKTIADNYGESIANAVNTYLEHHHGKGFKLGKKGIPVCTDCHGKAHNILSQKNPESPTSPERRAEICSREDCHGIPMTGAGAGSVHGRNERDIIGTLIKIFYTGLIGLFVGGMTIYIILDLTLLFGRKKGGE